MDKKILIISFVLALVLCLGVSAIYFSKEKVSETDALKFKQEYESLNGKIREKDGKEIRNITIDENNPIVYKNEDEIVQMIQNKETFVVYFGFSDCPWCRSIITTLIEVATNLSIKPVYYVDVKEIRDRIEINQEGEQETTTKGTDGYYQLLELLDNVLNEYTITDANGKTVSTGEKRIGAPNVITIVDGKAQKMETGISTKQNNGYMELTEEMKAETYDTFECMLRCLNENKKTCSLETRC